MDLIRKLSLRAWPRRFWLWWNSLALRMVEWLLRLAHGCCRQIAAAFRAVGDWRVRSVLFYALIVGLLIEVGILTSVFVAVRYLAFQIPHNPPVRKIVYLNQGWGDSVTSAARQHFYYTPQGTSFVNLRYQWFVHLERADSTDRFADPSHMRSLGFIVDNIKTPENPYHLPVGFTRHFDTALREEFLDFTCAACHTGELHVVQKNGEQVAIRIDGGQAMHAFTSAHPGHFGPGLMAAMTSTWLNPFKFNRFARNVLGEGYDTGYWHLYWEFGKMLGNTLMKAANDTAHGKYPVDEGFGRTDAIARISNNVFGDELDRSNYVTGNAPASYPAVWDAYKFDWVQYAGSVAQPLARNMGEALGVGARVNLMDAYGRPIPPERRFSSQVEVENLVTIEETLRKLKPPQWPEEILGKPDEGKVKEGKRLYGLHCKGCHEPCTESPAYTAIYMPLRKADDPLWHVNLIPIEEVGTDPQSALNFYNDRVNLEKTGLPAAEARALVEAELREQQARKVAYAKKAGLPAPPSAESEIQRQLDGIDIRSASIGAGLNYIGLLLRKRYYEDLGVPPEKQQLMNGYGALDIPQVKKVYKARPLGGVWATAPYLHNGSVPNLYEMLVPAEQRSRKFFISRMNFDPVMVGLVKEPLVNNKGFWFDTTLPGNLNVGHEFRAGYGGYGPGSSPSPGVIGPELKNEERWALVEYLKTHVDDPAPCGVHK